MKQPKRYTSAAEIEASIDKCHEQAARCRERADELDRETDTLLEQGARKLETVKIRRRSAKALRTKANGLDESRARHLSAKLAEFRTIPLGFLGDASVSARLR